MLGNVSVYKSTVRITVPEIGPKSFGAFEKRTLGPACSGPRARFSKVPVTLGPGAIF